MKSTIPFLVAITLIAIFSPVHADYGVSNRGEWPDTWPKDLEPLRKQAQTYEGPLVLYRHYLIPFTKREEFEAAWPHLLKVKTKGAPIILMRSPYTRLGRIDAGVFIHTPPLDARQKEAVPEVSSEDAKNAHGNWRTNATYIELVVDGNIVDLNRIALPADTLIIDERFKDEKTK